jgi:predicted ATP-dependent protease
VNQKGNIQPIGGVNEKIEGFFDVCHSRRITGRQGVIIPHQNVQDLLLRPEVIAAVKARRFHIYPIKTIGEGVAILTGVAGGKRLKRGFTPGSVFRLADEKLREMAMELDRFGREASDKNNMKNNRKRRANGNTNDE